MQVNNIFIYVNLFKKILNNIKLHRDEISPELFATSKLILVDHHVSPYNKQVCQVFDHRPIDPAANFPIESEVIIKDVGSCATLIAEFILNSQMRTDQNNNDILKLLQPVIVLDTVNFSEKANKAKPLDFSIFSKINEMLKQPIIEPEIYLNLVSARSDVSCLDSFQILLKDMKIVSSKHDNDSIVAIPGFPVSVQVKNFKN